MFEKIYSLKRFLAYVVDMLLVWLNLDVEDIKPAGLTETQKNWRKTFKN